MAGTFKFELVSPERLIMSEQVEQVDVPGTEGYFGVLAGHAPVVSTLRPGVLVVMKADGEKARIFVRGGFAEVDPESLTILAQQAVDLAELDVQVLQGQIRDAEEDLADASDEPQRSKALELLDRLRELEGSMRS